MSAIADTMYAVLKELFQYNLILKEYYVQFKNNRLFFDFFIKDFGILVEVQGQQHINFVKHFHQDKLSFLNQKKRDNLKRQYVEENNNLSLVRFYYNEKINKKLVMKKIKKALEKGFYE